MTDEKDSHNSRGHMFKNKSLRFKLLSMILGIVSFIVVISVVGILTSRKTTTEFNYIVEKSVPNLQAAAEIRIHMLLLHRNLSKATPTMDPEEIKELKDEWLAQVKKHEEILADYEKTGSTSTEEQNLWKQYVGGWKEYLKHSVSYLDLLLSTDPAVKAQASQVFASEVLKNFLMSGITAKEIWELHVSLTKVKSAEANEFNSKSQIFTLIISAAGIVFALLIGIYLANYVTKSLDKIREEISSAANETTTASSELTNSSEQLSSGATESAASLEETVSSLEELSSMVKLNSDHAKEANSLSQKSLHSAENGENKITKLIEAMSIMASSSKKIEEIINVIDDIAFQTNLLALNAAVEAARAGEQGKGFAVVADAVRGLAQRSASAAKDINVLIKESVEKTMEGVKIADSSGEVLKEIVTSVKKVADLNSEISAASVEQANGIDQISKAMNQLDQAIQDNASFSSQVATSAKDLTTQADNLNLQVTNLRKFVKGLNSKEVQKSLALRPKKNGNVISFENKKEDKIGKAEGF